jgi:hypothetical protein
LNLSLPISDPSIRSLTLRRYEIFALAQAPLRNYEIFALAYAYEIFALASTYTKNLHLQCKLKSDSS